MAWQGYVADHPIKFVLASEDKADAGKFVGTLGAPDGSPDIETVVAHQPGTISFSCEDQPSIMFGAIEIVR